MDIALLALFIVLGVFFLILEIFLLPGFGIGGIAGLGFIVVSIWYAFAKIGVMAGWITCVACVVMLVFGIWLFFKTRMLDKISLKTEIDGIGIAPIESLSVGEVGVARTRLAPMGNARFGDIDVEVRSEDGFIDPNVEVVISEVNAHYVTVRKQTNN